MIGHGGPLPLLAVEENVLGTCARLQTSTLRMKALFLVRSPLWLLHNLLIGAYFAIAVDIVSVLTDEITLAQTLETLGLATPAEASPASRLPTAALLRA